MLGEFLEARFSLIVLACGRHRAGHPFLTSERCAGGRHLPGLTSHKPVSG
jgi:hypothetical protein